MTDYAYYEETTWITVVWKCILQCVIIDVTLDICCALSSPLAMNDGLYALYNKQP